MSKRVKKWIKQIYSNIMWKAHKIIFFRIVRMVLKISYNTFFLEGSLKDKYQAMKTSFFRFIGVKSTCIAKNNVPCLLYFREILCTLRVFGTCWNIWSTLFIPKQIIYIYTRKSKLKCKWKKLKSLLKMKIKNWHLA